jgi:two-component system NtrC family sensor kinase
MHFYCQNISFESYFVKMKKIFIVLYLIIQNSATFASATDTVRINGHDAKFLTNEYFLELEDRNSSLTIYDVANNQHFHAVTSVLPFIKNSKSAYWLKFILKNNSPNANIPITIGRSVIDEFDIFFKNAKSGRLVKLSSQAREFNANFTTQTITFINVPLASGTNNTIFILVKSNVSSVVPVEIHSADQFDEENDIGNIVNGGVMGVFLIMTLYNLMLYITVKDRSYLYYVFYIVALGVSQILVLGYGNNFLDNKTILNNYVFSVSRVLLGYSMLLFAGEFLQLKQNLKRYYRPYLLLYVMYGLPMLALLLGGISTAFLLISISAFTTSIALLFIGIVLYSKGYRPAKFFLMGWGLSLVAILLSVARNKGWLPYNHVMANVIIYSAIIELVLFSVALADKINFYRHQNDESQFAALAIAKENERLITEQNILLENKVKERTQALIETNQNLSVTIENLKSAQLHLIETEKMASLGLLTAGVAHEINNPINFVSANVAPLKLDVKELFELVDKYDRASSNPDQPELLKEAQQYKEKIDPGFVKDEILSLLDGIEDGANRTSEIVQSLRTFSRMDELVLKPTNINTAVLNTLILLRSSIPYYIEVRPILNKLEPLNCYSGKINQILINLINNSIQAIKAKDEHQNESILITTRDEAKHVAIEITDTGVGINANIKQRIFEPFFTTKDVGEGTGLGLSIVFGIIEKHKGTIEVDSIPGKGATFTIRLPKNLR